MDKNKSKYFNTATLFDEALISLLEIKDIEYISVKEICLKAGFNRSTFYLHYESINDLVEETLDYINKKFINYFNESSKEFIEKIKFSPLEELNLIERKYLEPYLNYIKENKKIFKVSINNPSRIDAYNKYSDLKKYIIIPILERFHVDENEKKYLIAFYFNGIIGIIKEWMNDDCKDDILDVINLIIKYVKKPKNLGFFKINRYK